MAKFLRLDLDELAEEGYLYSSYDISGAVHSLTIKQEDREAFLDDYASQFRKMVEKILTDERDTDWIKDDE
jgi:hypothetical protein